MPKVLKERYLQSSVISALEAVSSGTSIRKAAAQYGIPVSTLFGKVKNIHPVNATMGPSSILTAEEENNLVEWIFNVSEKGFPVTKKQLLDNVQKLVTEMKIVNPFTNNRPGRNWYKSFCRRHPELHDRVAQNLTHSRASATEDKLENWFQEVSEYLRSKDLLGIDPSRVFNCDESSFLMCPKADNDIVRQGAKPVYKNGNVDEKENITTLFMANAAGTVAPPMVMFSYQRIPSLITENLPSGWSIGKSDKGSMTAETFYEYITNVFYPWLQENGIQFPIILFINGHSSHCTLPLSTFCTKVKIELIALYPNTTHTLQPLDIAIFHPLKNAWKKMVNNWRIKNNGVRLKKDQFAPLLKTAVESLDLEDTIKNGFRTCGLSPFSADFNILEKGMSSNVEQPEIMTTLQVSSKFVEHLQIMEQQLPVDVLREFKKTDPSDAWTGETTNEGLYHYWRRMKQLAGITYGNEVL